ncbi:MAG TPA: hypothetical protein VL742_17800 [Casimicrobiaceae bacterium]|nr:hypothetical protein [Casimicrobiaceae bacterium]
MSRLVDILRRCFPDRLVSRGRGRDEAPFELAFVLTDGEAIGDANNLVELTDFTFGAGGSAGSVDTLLSTGGASGDLTTGVALDDTAFFNVLASTFTPGSLLSFDLSFSTQRRRGWYARSILDVAAAIGRHTRSKRGRQRRAARREYRFFAASVRAVLHRFDARADRHVRRDRTRAVDGSALARGNVRRATASRHSTGE